MGYDFSIGCSDCTSKRVSYIMFQMVKLFSQIKDNIDIDIISKEDKHVSIEQLAIIIWRLNNDLSDSQRDNEFKTKFVERYKFYEDETFEEVYENCKTSRDLFVDTLVDSIMNKENKIYWNYS